ncbi:unnamed protein product [Candidula unifasciata]|uniref:Uncharacterized protein n=1 Tax=Candidula unifasciata TaxID=100452 RepID=A0A8S3YYF4_9EUPU|nr:unnamed protein product [Candidula unifasciata]
MSRNPPSRTRTSSNRTVRQLFYHNVTGASEFHQHTTSLSSPDDGFGLFFQSNEKEMSNVPVTFEAPLPIWLKGTLVRNGLGLFEKGPRSFVHAFDGFAKLASWKFMGNESALFSTRFLRSMFYKSSMEANTITPYLLFHSVVPPFGYIEKLQCLFRGIDNMNVNIVAFQNSKNKVTEYAALNDFWIVYKVTIDKLSTKHKVIPNTGILSLLSSSHPLPEPGTKNHLNFLSSLAVLPWRNNMINLMRIKSLKRRSIIAQWPVDRVPCMHSFLVEMLQTITVNNIFTMHHVNAYDLGNNSIIMDVSSYPSPEIVSHLQLHVLRDPVKRNSFAAHAQLKRIFIDLIKNEAHEIPLDQSATPRLASHLDMPVINEAYRSKHYCFVYGLVFKADNKTFSNIAVVKKDVCHDGQGDRIWQLDGHYPVEPWFVADPQGVDEDDGLLLVPVLDGERKQTYLIVLDARTLTLTNRAVMPTNIPYSLHGRFFPGV